MNLNSTVLQWGRDLSVAEGLRLPARAGSNTRASMGPRPFGRGRQREYLLLSPKQVALQWGRDLSVAEGTAP